MKTERLSAQTHTLHRSPTEWVLLVLSDGKSNDVGRYGVEDACQAVVEARLQGIHTFCVTVDRHAPAYMPRIFGAAGFAALYHPEHLPSVLVDVLRQLVKSWPAGPVPSPNWFGHTVSTGCLQRHFNHWSTKHSLISLARQCAVLLSF